MAVKERSQIKGTDAQIKAFAGHNGVLAFATDTKSLHVLSGTAGTTTEFLPSNKVATKTELEGKLSLTGGTMTGDIIFSSSASKIENAQNEGGKVEVTEDGAALLSNKGDFQGGATLLLRSSTYPNEQKGCFYLISALAPGHSYNLIGSPDGSLTWGGKPVLCGESGGFPVGFIAMRAGTNVPDGWFRCDGSTIADMATNYPKLYAVLGTNVLPNYSGRYPLGAIDGINDVVAPGLPNIQGTLNGRDGVGIFQSCTEAFGSNETTSYLFGTYIDKEGRTGIHKTTFKASNSSSIYGASTTVTPPSIKTNFIIKHD